MTFAERKMLFFIVMMALAFIIAFMLMTLLPPAWAERVFVRPATVTSEQDTEPER